ncbi:S41 family peptidase [Mucilaginibacter sp. RS28]|uniref:S41 family peptidase n=1 Tax=Mucilaginibacter straminoryzae TaxID=2932774 RepID=A0A9X2BCQ3_9SPHI|nr:S41 family peptidase [Mucilaginibacter straminoryzae]MCJ8211202.1 S41 family peptidase [Mucilaginibacter straminoryzae]
MKFITVAFITIIAYTTVSAQNLRLTKADKTKIINRTVKELQANYVNLDTARKMSQFIRQQFHHGMYDTISSPRIFAEHLTSDLLAVYHDGHLSISYEPGLTDQSGSVDTVAERQRFLNFRKKHNFGFDKAEILPGNIGYLKISGFFPTDLEGKAMALAAFRFVSNAKALILDLRENRGGEPAMVSYVCGFFFPSRTHLNDLYTRSSHSLETFWADPNTELTALQNIPIYILTSKTTFSAGEELTYDLQTQKRAMVIGEATGGGAHPVQPFPLVKGFIANIPYARAINPVTQTNWEGKGVQPDLVVPADQALSAAVKLAGEQTKH